MRKPSDTYTVFILPDPTSKPYGFSIRKKTFRILLGFLSVAVIALFGFVAQSLSLVENTAELSSLREKSETQREQVRSALDSVSQLKQQMAHLLALDEKLRIMTDLSPKKRASGRLAQGGPEEQMDTVALEEGDIALFEEASWDENSKESEALTQKILNGLQQDLVRLNKQIDEEQESFRELIQAISSIQLRWESTPSIWPVQGWMTSPFGLRISPFTGRWAMHNGIDISAHRGTPIIAPAAGTVQRVSYDAALGRGVFIRHDYGKMTIYGHMDRQVVRVGQNVARGDVIGYVGSTGKSTGPHLHYEVRVNGTPVNPIRFIAN